MMKIRIQQGQVAGGRWQVAESQCFTRPSPLDTRHLTKICPALNESSRAADRKTRKTKQQ
jgi:hypothetical protein